MCGYTRITCRSILFFLVNLIIWKAKKFNNKKKEHERKETENILTLLLFLFTFFIHFIHSASFFIHFASFLQPLQPLFSICGRCFMRNTVHSTLWTASISFHYVQRFKSKMDLLEIVHPSVSGGFVINSSKDRKTVPKGNSILEELE